MAESLSPGGGFSPRSPTSLRQTRAAILTAVLVVVGALYVARDFLIPVALAMLLSFLLAPLVTRLQRWGLGRIPAVIVVVGLSFAVIGGVGWLVAAQLADMTSELPHYRTNIIEKIRGLRSSLGFMGQASEQMEALGREIAEAAETQPATAPATQADEQAPSVQTPVVQTPVGEVAVGPGEEPSPPMREVDEPLRVQVVRNGQPLVEAARQMLGPLLRPIGTAAIVVVFVIFMLIQREDLRDRLLRLIGAHQINVTTEALHEAAHGVSTYLLMHTMLNAIHGAAIGIGLLFIGLPSALLWGLLAALLRFLPYIGPWLSAVMPIALSLAVFDGWVQPLLVLGLFVVTELISNQVLEPYFYGTRTGASPLAVLVSAFFWTWLWGGVGLVMATPITVCLVVMGKYVPQLGFFYVLLGDQPVLSPAVRLYQRLLARDEREAKQISRKAMRDMSLEEVYDRLLIPALVLMERDRAGGRLQASLEQFITAQLQDMVATLGEETSRTAETPTGPPELAQGAPTEVKGLCVPARDEGDELAALMLVQLLRLDGYTAEVTSADLLASELIAEIAQHEPDVVCISALPPSTVRHARYLLKRMTEHYPELPVVLGLWDDQLAQDEELGILRSTSEAPVVWTVGEARRHMRDRLHRLALTRAAERGAAQR